MRTGKKWNSIKNIFVVLLLVALTFAALDLQRRYYDRADERLFSRVMLNEYSVTVVNDRVDIYQKMDALKDDSSIVGEGNEEYDSKELETYRSSLMKEIYKLLACEDVIFEDLYEWRDWIVGALSADGLTEHLHMIDILRVDDDKLYSFSLGIYEFWNPDYAAPEPSVILFDTESGKILYVQACADESVTDMFNVETEDYSYDESSFYDTDIELYATMTGTVYGDLLSNYYRLVFDRNTNSSVVTDTYLTISPFSYADIQGETFADIYDIIYRDYGKWF